MRTARSLPHGVSLSGRGVSMTETHPLDRDPLSGPLDHQDTITYTPPQGKSIVLMFLNTFVTVSSHWPPMSQWVKKFVPQ